MLRYSDDLSTITPEMLIGFFAGWPNPPSPKNHLRILHGSAHVILAIDDGADRVVGFITAISDGVMAAYIPLLEVLPEHRKQGIGGELVRRMMQRLGHLYMVDVMCDADVVPFYERLGLNAGAGAMRRNYAQQSCEAS